MIQAERERLQREAESILDSLHDQFLFDKRSDSRIEAIENADARLRVILCLLVGHGDGE